MAQAFQTNAFQGTAFESSGGTESRSGTCSDLTGSAEFLGVEGTRDISGTASTLEEQNSPQMGMALGSKAVEQSVASPLWAVGFYGQGSGTRDGAGLADPLVGESILGPAYTSDRHGPADPLEGSALLFEAAGYWSADRVLPVWRYPGRPQIHRR